MASTWYRSKAFILAAVVVGLIVVALLLAPFFISVEQFKPLIVAQLSKTTGRQVELEGIGLRLLPSAHVTLENLHIKNPEDFPAGDTVAVKSIGVGLALMPLLRKQVEVTSVSLSGVELNLLENERGENNYESLTSGGGGKAKSGASGGMAVGSVGSVEVSDVAVSSGRFWRREKRVYPSWTLKGLNLEASGFDFSDPDWLQHVAADVDLSKVELASPSLKQPLRFTDGSLTVKDNTAQSDFTLGLGSLRAQGSLKASDLARHQAADVNLSMKELNLGDVSAALTGASNPGPRGSSRGPSNTLLARGTVKIGRVVAAPLSADNFDGKFRLYADRLELDPFGFNLYSGHARGSAGLDLASESMPVRLSGRIEGVNVAQFIAAATPESQKKITGTFESDVRLGAALGAKDVVAALTGSGTFAVRDGTFPGLDIGGSLANMAKFMQMNLPSGDTRFSLFGGDFNIADQRVHSRDLQLKADSLDADLRGSFGFDETLDYTGTGVLKGSGTQQAQQQSSNPLGALKGIFGKVIQQTMKISGARVPFGVKGTLQDPKFTLLGPPEPIPMR